MFSPEIRWNKILPSRINLTIYNRLYVSEKADVTLTVGKFYVFDTIKN